ncbi:hypothetical protein D3C71_1227900 [compost metagenome]
MAVIDRLEVINVQHQQRLPGAVLAGAGQLLDQGFFERAAVGQAGECVLPGQFFQLHAVALHAPGEVIAEAEGQNDGDQPMQVCLRPKQQVRHRQQGGDQQQIDGRGDLVVHDEGIGHQRQEHPGHGTLAQHPGRQHAATRIGQGQQHAGRQQPLQATMCEYRRRAGQCRQNQAADRERVATFQQQPAGEEQQRQGSDRGDGAQWDAAQRVRQGRDGTLAADRFHFGGR